MKKLFTFTNILGAVAVLGLVSACETAATNSAANAMSQKEMMLSQAGFRPKTVTTAKQQQQVSQLAAGRVSMVKYQGKIYYVYPTSTRNQIFVGNKSMYQAYKSRMIQAQKASQAQPAQQPQQMTKAQQAQQALAPIGIQMDPDPRGVSVQEFDGFGPMDVISE
jgi:outer membrane lipoprotein-sorting protein